MAAALAAAASLVREGRSVKQMEETTLAAGHRVKIIGLQSRPELNDSAGCVMSFNETSGRYAVIVVTVDYHRATIIEEEQLALRPFDLSQEN